MRKLNKSELKRVYGAGWAKGGGHDHGNKVGDTVEIDHDMTGLDTAGVDLDYFTPEA